jgi:hypothetical protein
MTMTVNEDIIEELAWRYFDEDMPQELIDYLYDQYEEEPLAGDLAPQFFWPSILSVIEDYTHGKLTIRLRTDMEKLQDRYNELDDIVSEISEERWSLYDENKYLKDYIRWLGKQDEFQEFKEQAHEELDEYGMFSYYVM